VDGGCPDGYPPTGKCCRIPSHHWHIFPDKYSQVSFEMISKGLLLENGNDLIAGQSPGQRLINIRYGNFTKLKGLLNYMLAILLPTTLDTLSRLLPSNSILLHKVIDRITLALKLVNFLYFFYFINQGGTANVIEKAVGLTSIYDQEPSFGLLGLELTCYEKFKFNPK
jgi:hypothetical protein